MNSKPEPAIWSRDTGRQIAWFDRRQNQRYGYGNGAAALAYQGIYGQTDA